MAPAAAAASPPNAFFSVSASSLLLLLFLATLFLASAQAQTVAPNVTQVLTQAGNFSTFLALASAANVSQDLQAFISSANTTGATAFIPLDSAFTNGIVTAYKNLSAANQRQVLLYHALPKFYNATDVLKISNVTTLASYHLAAVNQSSSSGVITVYGNLNSANVVTNKTVNATTFPIAIHAIDAVLLPKEIFGAPTTVTPPVSAPSPSPSSSAPSPSSTPSPSPSTSPSPSPSPSPSSTTNTTVKAPAPAPSSSTTNTTAKTPSAPAPSGSDHTAHATTLFISLSSVILLSFHLIFSA